MPNIMWRFKKLGPGAPERDPHEAEFFRLTDPPEAIIREVIQNSLDARSNAQNLVRVRFAFGAVQKSNVRDYLGGDLECHLKACELPSPDTIPDRMRFLAIEDFGTSGLDGPTGEDGHRPEERSNFYNFWWCEGKSKKSGREAGRWGLGKTTFHIVSKIRLFWGLTVRQDDHRELLLGKVLLKTHRIDNDVYQYYGYYTASEHRPVADEQVIHDFRQKFSLTRQNEVGFSLVIPAPYDEIDYSSVIRSVVIHYFYAIMKGILEVEIQESDNCLNLNAGNLVDIACSQDWQGTSWEGVNVGELMQFIKDSTSIRTDDFTWLTVADSEIPEITEDSFDNRLNELRTSFTAGNTLAFRIPVMIKRVRERSFSTHFEVYLKRYPQLKQSGEFYTRAGITIPVRRTMGNYPVRGLLVAEEAPIVTFLGDSETPAHTEWNEKTEGFKERYVYATKTLRFIKKSMSKIVSILDLPPQERQRDFLKEIFSIPEISLQENKTTITKPVIPTIKRKRPLFDTRRINTGFRVSLKRTDSPLPVRATVIVAYDVRRGNPFRQYEWFDFDLGGELISINSTGCAILNRSRNIMEIEVTDNNFNLEVTGFDQKRDLVVNINTREEHNETQV